MFFGKKFLATLTAAACLTFGATVAQAKDYPSAEEVQAKLANVEGAIFDIGKPNVNYEKYFTGKTYLAPLSTGQSIGVGNVTFIDGAHTFWHIHHGTCQILVAESGAGYVQIWGQEPVELLPGVVFTVPEGVKHWHGAAPGKMMQHVAIMQSNSEVSTEWLEPVDDKFFRSLKK
ncbi:MAG: cupin domain-containing protein [Selenomonadaceae bacterium]|nr:cupin domain-containing protein [Selenomonadaceae bacterium]